MTDQAKPTLYELAARAGALHSFADFRAMPEAEQIAAAEAADMVFITRERMRAQFLAEALAGQNIEPAEDKGLSIIADAAARMASEN